MRTALEDRGTCVYVNFKSGRDRSAQTVYAFLRLTYAFSDRQAREALSSRCDRSGKALANIDGMRPEVYQWLQQCLARDS